MIPRALDQIDEHDLDALRNERRVEDRRIEYKSRLPEGADADTLERERIRVLWKPIASFANTDGGDLIVGIVANGGVPNLISGIDADVDRTKLEIENLVQSGIAPRVRLQGIRPVPLANGRTVFVVRVPRSWSAPHRVNRNAQFYYRTSAGVLEMDVATLRREFLLSDSIIERVRSFIASRQASLANPAADMPARIGNESRAVLHIVPVQSYADPPSLSPIDLRQLEGRLHDMMHFNGGAIWHRLTFEGLLIASGRAGNPARAYLHLFRNGSLECVVTNYHPMRNDDGAPSWNARNLEGRIVDVIGRARAGLAELGIVPPFVLSFGLFLAANQSYWVDPFQVAQTGVNVRGFFRSHQLASPELILQDDNESVARAIRPAFDALWNALDVVTSPNFGADGEWLGQLP